MKRIKMLLGVVAVVVDLSGLLSGCVTGVVDLDDDIHHSGKVEASASFTRTLQLDGQISICITGQNGAIKVWGVPGAQEVTVDAIRRVRSDSRLDAEAHLADVQVSATAWPGEFVIETIQPGYSHGRSYLVDYEITVPSHLVHHIANGNGSIRVEGVNANVKVDNGNGTVELVGLGGSSWVSLGNGEIATSAHLPAGGKLVHAVGNGTILLSVQPQVSAVFDAAVGNGTISMTGLQMEEVVSNPRRLKGVLGAGEGTINLYSGNGQIQVHGG